MIFRNFFAISVSSTSLRNSHFLVKLKEILNDRKNITSKIMFILSEVEYYSQIDRYNNILKHLEIWEF